jgi:SAM-dependent methyltransferase
VSPQSIYTGDELDVFAAAHNWKGYWRSHAARFISGDVAEVGAGIGTNTQLLCRLGGVRRWVCLEPDPALVDRLRDALRDTPCSDCEVINGTLEDLPDTERFDSIVYIDVLEHIEDDRAELRRAAKLLRRHGTLVTLSPAHQWLFTAFDAAIGHKRRYTKSTLASAVPPGMSLEILIYLDSTGLIVSAANRLFLRSARPTRSQIKLWDSVFVRGSQLIDPLLGHSLGKSVLGVWRAS